MSVTIKQISELCGVSRGTVDRVLNNRGKVKPEPEQKVREVADRLGYTPNMAGKALAARKRDLVIGVALVAKGNAFFDDVLSGIRQAGRELADYGVRVSVHTMKGYDVSQQCRMIREVGRGVHALIVNPINDPQVAAEIDALTESGVCLSASTAEKLGVGPGDALTGIVERGRRGAVEKARVRLTVTSVLPLAAEQKDMVFLPLPLLEAAEDFRDGRAASGMNPADGWTGSPLPDTPRVYAGFRLYARTLENVPRLRDAFRTHQVDVYTHADEIEQVMTLSASLGLVFSLISIAAAIGFAASTASSALAGVKRKERVLGQLRLMGFPMTALLLFPLTQALLTAVVGTALASLLYLGASQAINIMFADSIGHMESLCRLLPQHFAVALGMATALSLAAALGPALRAARIDPSEVIRDV